MNLQEFLTPGWIGLFITLIGFITYYLGRIVLDFYPSKEDKPMHHIVGIILFLIYFAIPISLIHYFPKYIILNLNWVWFLVFWGIYGIINYYLKIKFSLFQIMRGQVSNLFLIKFSEMMEKFGMDLNKMKKSKKIFTDLPSQIKVIFLGYALIFLVLNMVLFFDYIFIQIIIFIATISNFNKILVLHNAKSIVYPKIVIKDIFGKKYSGSLVKQDENYIILNNGKEIFTFPKENVNFVNKKQKIDLRNVEKKIGEVAKKTKPFLERYFPNTQNKKENNQQLKTEDSKE
jgi:hypothetical protein